jgi:hypothetical protein
MLGGLLKKFKNITKKYKHTKIEFALNNRGTILPNGKADNRRMNNNPVINGIRIEEANN